MAIKYKICPKCGSKDVLKIVYGMPSYELFKEAENGKIKLGGCMIAVENNPEYGCNDCEYEWNRQEVIDKEYKSIEKVKASIGGYFGPEYNIEINLKEGYFEWTEKENQTAVAECVKDNLNESEIFDIIDKIKMIDLLNWKRKFINSEIMDGTCWSSEIFKNKKSIRIHGVNDYPKEWELFCKLIKDVSGKPFE
jgi:hypothetical protein